jgi:sn1-specific diacylglycerol lipase
VLVFSREIKTSVYWRCPLFKNSRILTLFCLRHGKLDELLLGDSAELRGYRLRVTGHSLGGGCAAVLALLLRKKFPRVRGLSFSPPGCTVSENLAEEMSDFVTSFILDTDIIGRAGVTAFENFRSELLEMIARIKIPKHQVLSSHPRRGGDLEELNKLAVCDKHDIKPSKFAEQLEKFHSFQAELKSKHKSTYVDLFPPGKIIQMFRTLGLASNSTTACIPCCRDPEPDGLPSEDVPYTARWAERTDFRRIILSSHLLSDHGTSNVKAQLHDLAHRFGLVEPYSSVISGDEMCSP